jgi:K+-transporting ATPase ATPase C chain
MPTHLRPALVLFAALTVITGIVYPLALTGFAQAAFPKEANGSLIIGADHMAVGSALIGQEFGTSDPATAPTRAGWFWGRPSATAHVPYTALNLDRGAGSTGSNLAQSSPQLVQNVRARIAALNAADAAVGLIRTPESSRVPIDLVMASGSGLDPHISPASAEYQIHRVAMARSMTEDAVRDLVRQHTTLPALGILGEPVVNVLRLNVALDADNH